MAHRSSLLAQRFPSNNFGDPVKSLQSPSVPYFTTASLSLLTHCYHVFLSTYQKLLLKLVSNKSIYLCTVEFKR